MSDREAMKLALKALDTLVSPVGSIYAQARKALRAALAAPEPVFDGQSGHPVMLPRAPEPVLGLMELAQQMKPLDADMAAILHANLDSLYIEDEPAAAPEPVRHPGYIIGNHWLETAYSRVCAGEAEAEVLRDCGWQRVADIDALLRDVEALWRDAERYRWMKQKVKRIPPSWDLVGWDAAIDAAMENKI